MKKYSFFLIITVCIANLVFSQNAQKIRELGLYTSDFNNFGIRFKTGTDDLMYRLTALSFSLSNAEYDFGIGTPQDEDEYGFHLAAGIEKPISLSERFDLFYGGEISYQYRNQDVIVDENDNYKLKFNSYGLGVVLGFSYYLSPKIKLSAEVIPGIDFVKIKEDDLEITGWKFGFSNESAGITLSYRF
ncbi:MAG: hypothetical protein AB2L24_12180 [Mangrovibacterium sp.]